MIEVIYKEEKMIADEETGSFSIPRNIRQVGLIGDSFRIYMEDYVYTFLKRLSEKRGEDGREGHLAILKGETHWKNDITYVFVRGCVLAEAAELSAEKVVLSEKDWEGLHQEEEEYFSSEETVGWFFSEPGLQLRMNSAFDSLHLKYFGADKICMLMDPVEKEEAFFRYENNYLIRQSGYYLYYEKNPGMQAYMIDKKQAISDVPKEKTEDNAVKSFRKKISENEEEVSASEKKGQFYSGFLNYAATACLAVTVLAAGFNFYRNYRQMEQQEAPVEPVSSPVISLSSDAPEVEAEARETAASALSRTQNEKSDKEEKEKTTEEKTGSSQALAGKEKQGNTKDTSKGVNAGETEVKMTASEAGEAPLSDTTSEKEDSPETAAPMRETYVIRPGDTLFQICLEHYGSLERLTKLCEINGISENDVIYPGEIIVLP